MLEITEIRPRCAAAAAAAEDGDFCDQSSLQFVEARRRSFEFDEFFQQENPIGSFRRLDGAERAVDKGGPQVMLASTDQSCFGHRAPTRGGRPERSLVDGLGVLSAAAAAARNAGGGRWERYPDVEPRSPSGRSSALARRQRLSRPSQRLIRRPGRYRTADAARTAHGRRPSPDGRLLQRHRPGELDETAVPRPRGVRLPGSSWAELGPVQHLFEFERFGIRLLPGKTGWKNWSRNGEMERSSTDDASTAQGEKTETKQ